MEKNNGKVIAIVALVVAVVALSAGFAAFSATLNITNASAVISATDSFSENVNYISPNSATCYETSDSNAVVNVTGYTPGTASGKIWSGIKIPLSDELLSVTCEATVENESEFTAYLYSLSTAGPIVCSSVETGAEAVTQTVLDTVCGATKMTVHWGNASPTAATDKIVVQDNDGSQAINGSTSITAHGTQKVYVTVETTAVAQAAADGDINVALPYIEYTYKTVAPSTNNG